MAAGPAAAGGARIDEVFDIDNMPLSFDSDEAGTPPQSDSERETANNYSEVHGAAELEDEQHDQSKAKHDYSKATTTDLIDDTTLQETVRIASLEQRIASLEQRIRRIAGLEQRIGKLEEAPASLRAGVTLHHGEGGLPTAKPDESGFEIDEVTSEANESDGDCLPGLSESICQGSSKQMVTPAMLDGGDMYTLNESVWDSMIFFKHGSIGLLNSAMLALIWAFNLMLQTAFILIIEALMMEPVVGADVLDGLLKFRLGLAHRAEFADKVTERSMAAQVCAREKKLHMAGEQMGMYDDLQAFVNGGFLAEVLSVFIQYLWLCTILRDVDNTYSIFRAACKLKRGRHTTRLIMTDIRDENEELAYNKAGDAYIVSRIKSTRAHSAQSDDEDADKHYADGLTGFMTIVKLITLTRGRQYFVFAFVCIPKVMVACLLYWSGARWLANTINFTDLILNGVALAFVLEFDEVMYSVFMPRRTKTLISNLEPLPLRPKNPGSRWAGLSTILVSFLVAAVMSANYVLNMKPVWWMINQGNHIVCSGNVDFIYTVNPATSMVHISQTTGEDVYTDLEEVIAQVAHVELQVTDVWEDKVGLPIFEAADSSFQRAVEDTSANSFSQIVQMSVWSLADAANVLPCRDLASGQSREASVQTLRVLMDDPTISGCEDIPRNMCADQGKTWLRAICPKYCRCEESLLSSVGFFGQATFGCPKQCETFKAAKAEIAFRFDLSKDDVDSTRHLQGSKVRGCSDLEVAEFAFPGGCADSNGERLDKNGKGCSRYTIGLSTCGSDDDDDFRAADLCCACGGGQNNVSSSLSCWDDFTEVCWYMPPKALAWLLYVRGLFEYSMSKPGFKDSVTNVVEKDYAGIAPSEDEQTALIEHIATGAMGRALANGSWELMPGLPHPRGLTGCSFVASYEITSLLNLDLCAEGLHTPVRFFCPNSCGCDGSNALSECPAACVLTHCTGSESSCGHVHPWFSDECIAGYHNNGGEPTCLKCTDGETRRRRSTSCTECASGFYDAGNQDNCTQCLDGATRRRRSASCTDCEPGFYDEGDSDDCSQCVGGATRRRRATSCTDCADGSFNSGDMDECEPCVGGQTRRRRSPTCEDCDPGHYNDGSSDDCLRCEGGMTRRRRSEACTACPPGTRDDGDTDDCTPVQCPANSHGHSLSDDEGCKCDIGHVGSIRPTQSEPYFSGACVAQPFHVQTSGLCRLPIADAATCEYAAKKLGESVGAVTSVASRHYPPGCHSVDSLSRFNTAVIQGHAFCNPSYRCVCHGNEHDFGCTDSNGTCPSTAGECGNYADDHDDDRATRCCICGGGKTIDKLHGYCVDTAGEATGLQGVSCHRWDWSPELCQWSKYYDDDDFSAADMCCGCRGGYTYTLTGTSTSETSGTTTSETSTLTSTSETSTSETSTSETSTASSTTTVTRAGVGLCGILSPVAAGACPGDADLPNCIDAAFGELCEGDGECFTHWDLDNCGEWDVYMKSEVNNYEHISPGCVNEANIVLHSGKSVAECAALCDADARCLAFEYGVLHGSSGSQFQARDCQLQSSAAHQGCDGAFHNSDLYMKLVAVTPGWLESPTPLNRSTLLGIITTLEEFELSFDILPRDTVSDWSSIIHFSATNNNCCDVGDRVPGLWIAGGTTRMHVAHDAPGIGNQNLDADRELPLNVMSHVVVRHEALKLEVFVNGVLWGSQHRTGMVGPMSNVRVYAADPWFDPALAHISNVRYGPPISGFTSVNASAEVAVTTPADSWMLGMNINPCDGNNMGYGGPWASNYDVGSRDTQLTNDYVDNAVWNRRAGYITIARHNNGMCEMSKTWALTDKSKSMYDYFSDYSPGGRIYATGDGSTNDTHIHSDIPFGSTGHATDPIFGASGGLVFNWWYSNNGARIAVPGGYKTPYTLPGANDDSDDLHGLGNDLGSAASVGGGSSEWWHDAAELQDDCHASSCRVVGSDHGTSWSMGGSCWGSYAIYISSSLRGFECQGRTLNAVVTPAAEWTMLWSSSSTADDTHHPTRSAFNRLFRAASADFGIIRRACPGCNDTHKDVYIRVVDPWNWDAYNLLLVTWEDTGFGSSFDIYSSFIDAQLQTNRWAFCNGFEVNIGFPRDCGPSGPMSLQWNSLVHPNSQPDYRYFVWQVPPPTEAPTPFPTPAPTTLPTPAPTPPPTPVPTQGHLDCGSTGTGATTYAYARDRWSFEAPHTGTFTFSTCGSAFDTYVYIYHGSSEVFRCDDCGPCGVHTVAELDLNGGQTYFVEIAGYSSSYGSYQVQTSCP